MFHEPKTKEEAAKYRYGTWGGNTRGFAFDSTRCAAEVPSGWLFKQCAKKPGHGPDALYCSMHTKKLTTPNVEAQGRLTADSSASGVPLERRVGPRRGRP